MKMNKKWVAIPLSIALSLGAIGAVGASNASAFSDLEGVPGHEKILQLRESGIINGVGKGLFAPHKVITTEQAVSLIVKGLDLNLDAIRFIKAPEASDYFTNIPNDAWYSQAFITAQLNGVPLDKDVKPGTPVTREQFVHMLMNAVYTKGDYAWIKIFMMMKDEDQVTDGMMYDIQTALIAKIASVDKEGNFRPLDPISRGEAAVMLHEAIQFVKNHPNTGQTSEQPEEPAVEEVVTITQEPINEDIQKVIVNWGEKPNAGYTIAITGVEFIGEETAIVKYRLQYPEPDGMYAQVIVEPKAHVYLDSTYKEIRHERVQ